MYLPRCTLFTHTQKSLCFMLYVSPRDFKRYYVNNSVKLRVQYNIIETTPPPPTMSKWTVDVTIHQQHLVITKKLVRLLRLLPFCNVLSFRITTTISFPLACMMLLLFVVVFQFHFKIKFCRHSQ